MTHGTRPAHAQAQPTHFAGLTALAAGVVALLIAGILAIPTQASAATAKIDLGTADPYSVLAGSAVTNTGPSRLGGELGVSPGTAITGFPPGVAAGATHQTDAAAGQAELDLANAYNVAAHRAPTGGSVGPALVGKTLTSGVYKATTSLDLGGPLTLDGQGDPDAVFIFQVGSTLVTDSASSVIVSNGAQACNVFWQVGSSATLGTGSTFKGTIMALTSVTVTTGVTVEGRAMARNGAVTLDNNVFTTPSCAVPSAAGSSASQAAATFRQAAASSAAAASSSAAKAAASSAAKAATSQSAAAAAARTLAAQAAARSAAAHAASVQSVAAALASSSSVAVAASRSSTGTDLANTGPSPFTGQLLVLGFGLLAAGGLLLGVGYRRRRS